MKTREILDDQPPAELNAEKMVVSAVMHKPSLLDELSLAANDFYADDLQAVYAALAEMHRRGDPIDFGLLLRRFDGDDWAAKLAEILHANPYGSHVPLSIVAHHAKLIVRAAKLRRLQDIGETLIQSAHSGDDEPEEVLERAETALASIRMTPGDGEPVSAMTAALEATARIDAIRERGNGGGVPTGISSFDLDQGGLFPGELIVLAARPGCGKTSLALQIAHHNAGRGRLVYFASLEMSAVELSLRAACGASGVSNRLVRIGKIGPDESRRLANALAEQSKAALEIHDRSALTVASIRREIRKRTKRGLVLAVIDYLQLITPEDRRIPREQQVAGMVRQLKETAREYEIPILCLCQLNRQADGEETPRLSHLRESGAIEQDADVVLFLQQHEPDENETHNAILTVAKNRNGETGALRLNWDGSRTRFSIPGHPEFAEFSQ